MHRLAAAAVLVLVTGIAFADELWISSGIQTAEARQMAASDRAFVSAIEHALGGHGMVFQIPYPDIPTMAAALAVSCPSIMPGRIFSRRPPCNGVREPWRARSRPAGCSAWPVFRLRA